MNDNDVLDHIIPKVPGYENDPESLGRKGYGLEIRHEAENSQTLQHQDDGTSISADDQDKHRELGRYDTGELDVKPDKRTKHRDRPEKPKRFSVSSKPSIQRTTPKAQRRLDDDEVLSNLGLLSSRNATGWTRLTCDGSTSLRLVQLPTKHGRLSMYVYDTAMDDLSVTSWALRGQILEEQEIERFLGPYA